MSTGMSSPPLSSFFLPSFFLEAFPFSLVRTAPRRLSLVPTASCCRRRAQGVSRLAAFQRATDRLGLYTTEHDGRLDGSGRLHSCPLPIYPLRVGGGVFR